MALLLRQVPRVDEVDTSIAGELRPGREAERWLNTLLRRVEGA